MQSFPLLSIGRIVTLHGVVTFHVSRRRHKMYIGHSCLCVCLSVPRCITVLHGPGCNLVNGTRCPRLVHRFCCYDNIVPNTKY